MHEAVENHRAQSTSGGAVWTLWGCVACGASVTAAIALIPAFATMTAQTTESVTAFKVAGWAALLALVAVTIMHTLTLLRAGKEAH